MFTLTNMHVNSPNFLAALEKLSSYSMPLKVSWNLGKIYKRCLKMKGETEEAYRKLLRDFFEADEAGNLIPAKDDDGKLIQGRYEYKKDIEDANTKWQASQVEFMQTEFEIQANKIKIEDLKDLNQKEMNIDGASLSFLEDIFEG